MATLDTATILEVIKMLDNGIENYHTIAKHEAEFDESMAQFNMANALENFRDHLQEYIEAQLNAFEMQSGE